MRVPHEHIAIGQVADRLAEIFEVPGHIVNRCFDVPYVNGQNWDAVFSVGPNSFAVEWKRSGSLNQVALAIHQMSEARDGAGRAYNGIIASRGRMARRDLRGGMIENYCRISIPC